MYCRNCGKVIGENQYCTYCGNAALQPLEQKAQIQPVNNPRKVLKALLIIGAAVFVLAAAAAALFFVLTSSVQGQWYNEERGEVLAFADGKNISIESLAGTQTGTYEYNRLKGTGRYTVDETSYDFSMGEQVSVDKLGAYAKADNQFDIGAFLDQYGSLGTWYNEERGEVLVFGKLGTLQSIHLNSVNEMDYEYNRDSQTGKMTLGVFTYSFNLNHGQLDIDDLGLFAESLKDFSTDKFINEYGDSLLGNWYDKEGESVLSIYDNGKCRVVSYGREKDSTYTVDGDTISLKYPSFINTAPFPEKIDSYEFIYKLKNGELHFGEGGDEDSTRIRDYVEPKSADQLYDDVAGLWIVESESKESDSIEFFRDGTAVFTVYRNNAPNKLTAEFEYEPDGAFGYFTVIEENPPIFETGQSFVFVIQSDGDLYIGMVPFKKEVKG